MNGSAAAEWENLRRVVSYKVGQFVFYEGHAVLGLYVLCSGRVKLTRGTAKGQQRLVGIIDAGKLIEKHAFQDRAVHQATCEALEPSTICILDRLQYLTLLEQNGDLAVRVIKLLSREMGASLSEADQLAFSSARERMAGLLLELGNRYGVDRSEGTRIALELKREELAQMAAVTVETAVRLLNSLCADHLIRLEGRRITLLDLSRLATISGRSYPPSAHPSPSP